MKKELYILILCVVLMLGIKSNATFDDTQTIRHIIWAVFTLTLLVMVLLKDRTIKVCGIFWAFSIFLLFSIFSLGKAISVTEGIYEVLRIPLMMVFLYACAKAIREDKDLFYKAMIVIGLLVGGFGVYHYFTTEKISRLVGLMSNRNQWSAVNMLLLPFCFTPVEGRIKKLRYFAVSFLLFNVITLCTRSVWVSLICASLVTAFVFKLIPKIRYITIGLVVVGISLFVASYQTHYFNRARNIDSLDLRYQKWSKTAKMFKDNPFFGAGIGNWPLAVSKYGNNYDRGEVTNETFFIRGHNDIIEKFSETGFIGGTAYLSIFIIGLYYAYQRINPAMFFGILCYIGFANLSFPWERPFQIMIFFLMVATVFPLGKPLGDKVSNVVCLALTALLTCSLVDFCVRFRSESYNKLMVIAKEKGQWQDVINLYDKGHSKWAGYDNLMSTPLIVYKAEAFIRLKIVSQALESFKEAERLSPYHTYILANLGSCYHLIGDTKTAKEYYEKSLEITPNFYAAKNNLMKLKGI